MKDGDDFIPLEEAERRARSETMSDNEYRAFHQLQPDAPIPRRARRPKVNGVDHRSTYDPHAPLKVLQPEMWQGQPIPTTRWIVDRVFPALAVCTLGGHGETGKSLLALQLGVARALGRSWLGFHTEQGRTLVVACEDPEEQIHIRLAGILRYYDADFADLEDRLRIVDRNDLMSAMMDWSKGRWGPGELTGFYGEIMNYALEFGADLICIDSRYDVFGGEQNDTPQVHEFMGAMRTLATEIQGAVLLLSHPSRAGLETGDGESGSVAWHNKVRSRLYLRSADPDRDGDSDRILEHLKSNWGPKFDPLPLRWCDGAFAADRADTGTVGHIERGVIERDFLDALDKLTKQGKYASDAPNSPVFAPKVMRQDFRLKHSVKDLRRAMNDLFEAGEIIVGAVPRGNRHSVAAIIRNPKKEAE